MQLLAYVYLRINEWFQSRNLYKMGVCTDKKGRSATYITGEPLAGEFIFMIEIEADKMRIIDKMLKNYFKSYRVYIPGSGTEFYNTLIIDFIVPYLDGLNIYYRVLTPDEIKTENIKDKIENLPNIQTFKKFIKKCMKKITYKQIINNTSNKTTEKTINPSEQQKEALDKMEYFYNKYDKGKLIWAPGVGKTLLSIFQVHKMGYNKVVIGVPSIPLLTQFTEEILKIFPNEKNILWVGGEKTEQYSNIIRTTNKQTIIQFINKKFTSPLFIITTYHSCYLLLDDDMHFDFKIGDEAHHLVGFHKETRSFCLFHKIIAEKTLFMTGTEKVMEGDAAGKKFYSMDDEKLFGKYIDIKTIYWAIENKKITDYKVVTIKNTEEEVDQIISSLKDKPRITFNKDLFLSCYMTLKTIHSVTNLTHIFLYTNTIEDAELANHYIHLILLNNNIPLLTTENIYHNTLHSYSNDIENEKKRFKDAKYGIISCVYMGGEGVNIPILNGVCVASTMKSEIRIVQYLLRPNRLDPNQPNKIAYIILPYIDTDTWGKTDNKSFERVKTIISKMRNEDEKIEQKIMLLTPKKDRDTDTDKDKVRENKISYDTFYETNEDELHKLKLRLRHSKTLTSNYTEEQDEYQYVRSINKCLGVKSLPEYVERRKEHEHYITDPEPYFKYRGVWTDLYDFLGVDTTKFIQSKQDWINWCKEKNIRSPDEYKTYYREYSDILPYEPGEFYKDFTNITNELGGYSRRR